MPTPTFTFSPKKSALHDLPNAAMLRNLFSSPAARLSRYARSFSATAKLPDLPYGYNELEPAISGKIMELHHLKHHAGYVNNYNAAIQQYTEAEKRGSISDMIGLQVRNMEFSFVLPSAHYVCLSQSDRLVVLSSVTASHQVQRWWPSQPLHLLDQSLPSQEVSGPVW